MTYFTYHNGLFHAESVSVLEIAENYGTPFYAYSERGILDNLNLYKEYFKSRPVKIFYAVKACSNLSILKLLKDNGAYFDVVSEGEIKRVAAIDDGSLERCIFSGVGKTKDSLIYAISNSIHCINIESIPEFYRIVSIAKQLGKQVNIAFRVNPNIDAKSHPYISTGLDKNKFGINVDDAVSIYKEATNYPQVSIKGISCHIGSQIEDLSVFKQCVNRVIIFYNQLIKDNITIDFIDFGGGLGISYDSDEQIKIAEYANNILHYLPDNLAADIYLEPGRSIIGKNGILVSRVEYIKKNNKYNFAIIDAGMNDLLRPSLYNAEHRIVPAIKSNNLDVPYNIVGPICETSDTFSTTFFKDVKEGDLLAFLDCGAYGASMSSNYNTRPNIPEILVKESKYRVIRCKQSFDELMANEIGSL